MEDTKTPEKKEFLYFFDKHPDGYAVEYSIFMRVSGYVLMSCVTVHQQLF